MSADPSNDSFVIYEKTNGTAVLTLNRPDTRNAIATHRDCEDLVAALDMAAADTDVSCIILTGSGTAFCAGGNITAMKERSGIGPLDRPDATRANYRKGVQRVVEALWECEVPMIAAINGHAVGLGLDLACLCDIRVASNKAKFASSFIKLGLVPGDGGAWILPRAVGVSRAAEMMFTGDTIDADAALSYGIVSQVVPADEVLTCAQALAARIVTNPARSLRLAKRLLREGQHSRLTDVLQLSAAFQGMAHETADHQEAVDAFIEKRDPVFTGK